MKRSLLAILLVTGLTIPLATPASAIFGLSTCEKVKKKIIAEEAIGRISWKEFDSLRKEYISDKKVTNGELIESFRLINLVHKSDLNVYAIASKNPECFSPKLNAYIRNTQSETKQNYDAIVANSKEYNSAYADLVNKDGFNYLNTYYKKYISVYDVKLN